MPGPYEVDVVEVTPTVIASVTERARFAELWIRVPKLLGEVWDYVKSAKLEKAGHNVAVYRHATAEDVEVECGVQVGAPFAGTERVRRSESPGGRAVHVVHWGDYRKLQAAYEALRAYVSANGLRDAEYWELYGDWSEDPAKLRTDVYGRLL